MNEKGKRIEYTYIDEHLYTIQRDMKKDEEFRRKGKKNFTKQLSKFNVKTKFKKETFYKNLNSF